MIYINNYPLYGLNQYRKFLKAPDRESRLRLETKKDVTEFCCSVLEQYPCPDSAIFAAFNDNTYLAVWKEVNDEDDSITLYSAEGSNSHFFSALDGEHRFCCYNLILEENDGEWII